MSGSITADTERKLSQPLYPPEAFVEMANASWGIGEPHQKATEYIRKEVYNYTGFTQKTTKVMSSH